MARGARRRVASMRHRIGDVVHGYADAQGGELLGIVGIVGVLPGVAQIHVVADGDHQAALVVVDAAPGARVAVLLVCHAAVQATLAGDLVAVIEIVEDVEDLVAVVDIDDLAVGKDALHAGHEDLPLEGAVEVVAHEEAAAEQVLAQAFGLQRR